MVDIARAACVSKQTVYKHFSDKRTLFTEMVALAVDESRVPTPQLARPYSGDAA
jgi:AcrR family transcriptional regulator